MPHLLKRLELNGFKSFAGKTVLEFPHGITAIVGPNGSGKSNVIDAIRWLLGERDAKNLRGGKGEDLIFAGTPKRPRVGLAQASLHFDNPSTGAQGKSRFFPVEFEEVTVMRQIARDGSSEYFLNKAEVRLKDIVDFFAAARLGSRGITVVTQGNSDMVLRASPIERREMIEEVLGLKEYQMKKHEAERRLKNSEVNLDKVKALMEEILPHLRSLKRQTSRWEKREEFEKELRDLENVFFGSQFRRVEEDLLKIETALRGHEATRSALDARKAESERRLTDVEANEPKEREELKALKQSIQEVQEKRGVLQRDLAKLETRIEIAAKTTPIPHGISGERLLQFVHGAKSALSDALKDPSSMEVAVRKVLDEIEALFGEAEAPKEEKVAIPDISVDFEKISKELREFENRIIELREREKSLEKNQEEFYAVFKAVLAEVQAAHGALEEWTRIQQGKTLEHERLLMRKTELVNRIHEAGRNPEEFRKEEAGIEMRSDAEHRMFRLRGELAAIGEIDEAVVNEARTTEERYQFLEKESSDLLKAEADLRELIKDLNFKIRSQFDGALVKINDEFQKFFELMFGGGTAKLKLVKKEPRSKKPEEGEEDIPDAVHVEEEEEVQEEGIEVQVSLPRKRISSLDMLSGGERSLVGIATLFALISVSPPPFLVLDEIDAPLDERNARRFAEMLKEFSKETQFIIVTHNRATMESADVLYGVTLDEDGTSKVLSMKFEEAKVK